MQKLCLALDDGHAGLKIRRLHIGGQAPLKAGAQTLFQTCLLYTSVLRPQAFCPFHQCTDCCRLQNLHPFPALPYAFFPDILVLDVYKRQVQGLAQRAGLLGAVQHSHLLGGRGQDLQQSGGHPRTCLLYTSLLQLSDQGLCGLVVGLGVVLGCDELLLSSLQLSRSLVGTSNLCDLLDQVLADMSLDGCFVKCGGKKTRLVPMYPGAVKALSNYMVR